MTDERPQNHFSLNQADFLPQLWPLTGEPFNWPPKTAFDAVALDELA